MFLQGALGGAAPPYHAGNVPNITWHGRLRPCCGPGCGRVVRDPSVASQHLAAFAPHTPGDEDTWTYRLLREYAVRSKHITEFGVFWATGSTWALLAGLSSRRDQGTLRCYDPFAPGTPAITARLWLAVSLGQALQVDMAFSSVSSIDARIEPTELLYIDSFHTYCLLRYELAQHADNVLNFIVIDDTTTWEWTSEFGTESSHTTHVGEFLKPCIAEGEEACAARCRVGLWPAIHEFLSQHSEWTVRERHSEGHGITILQRLERVGNDWWGSSAQGLGPSRFMARRTVSDWLAPEAVLPATAGALDIANWSSALLRDGKCATNARRGRTGLLRRAVAPELLLAAQVYVRHTPTALGWDASASVWPEILQELTSLASSWEGWKGGALEVRSAILSYSEQAVDPVRQHVVDTVEVMVPLMASSSFEVAHWDCNVARYTETYRIGASAGDVLAMSGGQWGSMQEPLLETGNVALVVIFRAAAPTLQSNIFKAEARRLPLGRA